MLAVPFYFLACIGSGHGWSAPGGISLPEAVVSLRVMHDLPERAELCQC